jgi:hypothetical protein
MSTHDPRIRREQMHGQEVLLPTSRAWREVVRGDLLNVLPSQIPEWQTRWLHGWLDTYSGFAVARLGLVRSPVGWMIRSLLKLEGRYYRVHFEDVICEHCGQRCGPSASPDTVAYAGTAYSLERVWEEFDQLPVCNCPHCGGELRRRQTVWLAATSQTEPAAPKDAPRD